MKRINSILKQAKEIQQLRDGVCIVSGQIDDAKLQQLRKRYEVIIIDDV